MHVCAHSCEGQKSVWDVILHHIPPYFSRQDFSLNLELTHWLDCRLTSSKDLTNSLCGYRQKKLCPAFPWGLVIQTRVLMLSCQALYQLNHLSMLSLLFDEFLSILQNSLKGDLFRQAFPAPNQNFPSHLHTLLLLYLLHMLLLLATYACSSIPNRLSDSHQ